MNHKLYTFREVERILNSTEENLSEVFTFTVKENDVLVKSYNAPHRKEKIWMFY